MVDSAVITQSSRSGNDLSIYNDYADQWWDPQSPYFRSLHSVNTYRMGLLDQWFGDVSSSNIADLGCGGGLFSLPLAERGATVDGFDISEASVAIARQRAPSSATYRVADIRSLPLPQERYDLVLLADVLEHIEDYPAVLAEAARILRPNGSVFVSTINRTFRAWLLALVLAERLWLVPPGTHSYGLFIRPDELIDAAGKLELHPVEQSGSRPRVFTTIRRWAVTLTPSRDMSVEYCMLLRKSSA